MAALTVNHNKSHYNENSSRLILPTPLGQAKRHRELDIMAVFPMLGARRANALIKQQMFY